jgi:hypothetical protein
MKNGKVVVNVATQVLSDYIHQNKWSAIAVESDTSLRQMMSFWWKYNISDDSSGFKNFG